MSKTPVKLHSALFVRDLELSVNLGWRHKERSSEQGVLLDLDIWLPKPPKACETDELDDTVCYAELSDKIRKGIGDTKYRLIEHLSRDIYQIVKKELPKKSRLIVRLTKFPKIDGLVGGVSFEYGDQR